MDISRLPVISVIMATFNSQKTLAMVLQSIRGQTYPQDKIEILVIDGGSSDATWEIADRFGCRIIDNPETEPGNAKYLGYMNAAGRYGVFLDSDEVIENKDSFYLKVKSLVGNEGVKAAIGSGYVNPQGYPFINDYINEFGDPFSFFIYRLSKSDNYFLDQMRGKYKVLSENGVEVIFDLSCAKPLPIIELVAAGSLVDLAYLRENFLELASDKRLIPHIFNFLMTKKIYIAIIKNDALIHYSSDTFTKYLNKIRSRVKNNIHFKDGLGRVGYSGRSEFDPLLWRLKKYLFIPYSFSILLPLLDALYLILTRRKWGYAVHLPLCLFTAGQIVYHYVLKLLGITPQAKSYGESITIRT